MKSPNMKSSLALFFQVFIVLIGIGILGFLLWEPHLEGRNAHATTFEIYFTDSFLAYVYVGSIPFFVALYRAFKMFGQVRQNRSFSPAALDDLRAIKRCAIALIGFVAGGVIIILKNGDPDDRPAGFFMGLLVALTAGAIATAATMFARRVRSALGDGNGRVVS
jgi:drug/metabolite transporter (DMT)-like permease